MHVSPSSLLAASLLLAPLASSGAPKVTTASGQAPADLNTAVAAFRLEIGLGGPGNTTNGPFFNGLRNINWDGAPDTAAAPNAMPADFFNNNVRRGAVFTSPGGSVQVSADSDNPAGAAVRFAHLDPSYSTRFKAFTEQRLFAAVGSTVIDTQFFVPGSPATPATVNGFGVVFTDVDLANVSTIECFDAQNVSLGKFAAPIADNGLSFVGVFFQDGERVARVRVTHGTTPLAAGVVDTATVDVVATDDFMFGEPLPLTTNATLINVSTRARVGTGEDVAIAGFVVGGTQPKLVLVRAGGPALAPFGVVGTLANPQLTLQTAGGELVATNDNWGNRPELAQAATRTGAYPFAAGSNDAAALVVLNPGAYSLLVSGVNGGTGIALLEVYEVK
ncbi:MAG: hypothetical protein JNN01_02220 [Opitutaceae bacterium]|nr:hypothetical protein [Opitutaceae bacterium]